MCLPDLPGYIWSVFVIVGVILGQSLPIYGFHLWRRLVRWAFGAIARRVSFCLLRQALHGSGDGGTMKAMR
jgi:hypothetical protein